MSERKLSRQSPSLFARRAAGTLAAPVIAVVVLAASIQAFAAKEQELVCARGRVYGRPSAPFHAEFPGPRVDPSPRQVLEDPPHHRRLGDEPDDARLAPTGHPPQVGPGTPRRPP